MLIRLLTALAWLCSLAMIAYTAYYFAVALFGFRRRRPIPEAAPGARFAVLAAARNGEAVIGELVRSLLDQDYPRELFQVIVVPNNCTDDTAGAARRAGATVLECAVPTRTKGEVLDWALNEIFRWERQFDAVLVFDADNLVRPDFLRRMNDAWQAGARVAQGFRDSKNPADTPISGCYSIYYWMIDRFYSQARSCLGLSAIVNGSGFLVSMELLRAQGGWKTATITEDIEFSGLCALRGEKVWWVPEAVTFDEQPLTFAQSWRQRRRWSTGLVQCLERYGRPLLREGLRGKGPALDILTFYILPLVQLLGLAALGLGAAFRAAGVPYGLFPHTALYYRIFFAVNLSFATTFLASLAAVLAAKKPVRPMLPAMACYWVFIMSWLPINLLCLVKKATVWEAIPHTRAISLSQLRDR